MRLAVATTRPFYKVFTVTLTVAILLGAQSVTVAAETVAPEPTKKPGITIYPTQKEIIISSGLVVANTAVTITNNTGARLSGTIKILDFNNLNESGGLFFAQDINSKGQYGLANWITLPNGYVISIANGQTLTFPVRIENRADLAPGGHYAAVVITSGNVAVGSAKAAFKQELASLLFVKKRGGELYGLQLDSLSADSMESLPNVVSMSFKNTGNVHVTPRGYITVADPKGKVVSKGIINPDSTLALPSNNKTLKTLLQPVAASKLSGKYKLTAYYRYDDQTEFQTKTIFINRKASLIPLIITGVIATVSILGVVWAVYRVRRLKT